MVRQVITAEFLKNIWFDLMWIWTELAYSFFFFFFFFFFKLLNLLSNAQYTNVRVESAKPVGSSKGSGGSGLGPQRWQEHAVRFRRAGDLIALSLCIRWCWWQLLPPSLSFVLWRPYTVDGAGQSNPIQSVCLFVCLCLSLSYFFIFIKYNYSVAYQWLVVRQVLTEPKIQSL